MDEFTLEISDEERVYLHTLVGARILARLRGRADDTPPPPPGVLHEKLGAFVTLNKGGQLRGCIGNLVGSGPLYRTVGAMAEAAAFGDRRFPPVTLAEYEELDIEISIMGPITRCADVEAIVIGRHGLIMRRGAHQGLLLPQVPVEWGWDREVFLARTCRKAGLPPDAWRDKDTEIYWFEAFIL